jgi:hypothetical protein
MPRIATLRSGAAIYVYADDHAPPHFHVRGPRSNAQIRIDTLEVTAGTIARRDHHEAIAYARENRDLLIMKWREFNERD